MAEDTINDQNQISTLLALKFAIMIGHFTFLIITVCFIEGMAWYMVTDMVRFVTGDGHDDYISYFELDKQTTHHNMIIQLYFALTTLSTVGFGDYYPVSNVERVLQSIVLVFGVSIFSYFMGTFIELLEKFQNLNQELDDGDTLAKFFGMIHSHYNGGFELPNNFKQRVEAHFDYKWCYDRTMAVSSEADLAIID